MCFSLGSSDLLQQTAFSSASQQQAGGWTLSNPHRAPPSHEQISTQQQQQQQHLQYQLQQQQQPSGLSKGTNPLLAQTSSSYHGQAGMLDQSQQRFQLRADQSALERQTSAFGLAKRPSAAADSNSTWLLKGQDNRVVPSPVSLEQQRVPLSSQGELIDRDTLNLTCMSRSHVSEQASCPR